MSHYMREFASLELVFKEMDRLRTINTALLEALEAYVAVYRRVMEQANKIDSDVWYAVTKAEQKARAILRDVEGESHG